MAGGSGRGGGQKRRNGGRGSGAPTSPKLAEGLDDDDISAAAPATSSIADRLRSGIGRQMAAARRLVSGASETNAITGTDEADAKDGDEQDDLTWEQRIRKM
jgi:hypothetical protein